MTSELGRVSPAGRYTPTKAARMLGMDPSTLWRKTKRGQIRCVFNAADGHRLYRGIDIIKYYNGEL